MSTISEARAGLELVDLVIAVQVEAMRASEGTLGLANGFSISHLIGGAPPREVLRRLHKLEHFGVVEKSATEATFQVTHMGVELLSQDVAGFVPTQREVERRDREMARAIGR